MMRKSLKTALVLSLAVATAVSTAAVPTTEVAAAKKAKSTKTTKSKKAKSTKKTKAKKGKSKKGKTAKAGKQKLYLVTKKVSNDGSVTKYSYNKKGLLSKQTSTTNSRTKDSDSSYQTTTSYKYNKKNRVAVKNYNSVSDITEYETDFEKNIKSNGKVTKERENNNTNTQYFYNKKGLLTKTVSTSYTITVPQNETETETAKSSYSYYDESDAYKTVDSIENISRNYTYTDNGNGTRTKVYTYESVEPSYSYEKKQAVDSKYNRTETTVTSNKRVTTTNYSYDKKKRVKATNSTTDYSSETKTENHRIYSVDGVKSSEYLTETVDTHKYTTRSMVQFSYNKKGKVSKCVSTSEPDVYEIYESSKKDTDTYYGSDNKTTVSTTSSTSKTEYVNNKKITSGSSTDSDGKVTADETKTVDYPANKYVYTTQYTYDKKGNVKAERTTYDDVDNRYEDYTVDENGKQVFKYNKDKDGKDDISNPIYRSKTTRETKKVSYDNVLKADSARITKSLEMSSGYLEGREVDNSYGMNRSVFTVKAKKISGSLAKDVEAQQWILQNGSLNGQFGLN
jgi:YD repeat-containing protein